MVIAQMTYQWITQKKKGTFPYATIAAVNRFFTRSASASAMSAGPKVISINKREQGYLVTSRNDITVNTAFLCTDQGEGSPYKLNARRMMNVTMSDTPT